MQAGSVTSAPARPPPPRCALGRRAQGAHTRCRANYRWSADTGGGRMRESLYGLDDNGEQRSASADGGSAAAVGAANACSSGAAEPWGEPWGAANAGAAAGENPRQQWEAAAQQQPWDIAAGERSARRRTRAGGSTRLGRRRQQAEQAAEHAKTAAGEEGEEEEEAAEAAAGPSVPPLEDPWVDAELRQLRRRQRAAARRGDQASAGGPLPDPWAAEWGPVVSPADVAAATEDFGWAAESWAGDGAGAGRERRQRERRQQQHEDEEEAGAGPGSAWDLAQEQRELRRRRRRQRAAAAGGADAQAAAAYDQQHQQQWGYNGPSGAQQQQQQQRQAAGFDAAAGGTSDPPLGDFEFKDNDDELRWGAGGVGGEFSGAYEPGLTVEPDVALLSTDELERVLPVVPFSQQAAFFGGTATDGVQRWGAALAATVVLSKVAVLAASSLTWPLWWPWALAAKKNLAVRRRYSYGGLWRTRVLDVTVTGRPKAFSSDDSVGGLLGGSMMRLARVLVGDPGGAQTELVLPYDARYELIQPGEPAELMVLSADPTFQSFKAVKDVYLPSSGLWVSEYPHADRTQFLEVSLQVEREAQEAADKEEQQQQQQQQQQPPPYGSPYEQQAGPAGWQEDGYAGGPPPY